MRTLRKIATRGLLPTVGAVLLVVSSVDARVSGSRKQPTTAGGDFHTEHHGTLFQGITGSLRSSDLAPA